MRPYGDGPCGCLSERGDETETREEAYGDPIPQNVNFLDQKSKEDTKKNFTLQERLSITRDGGV
jgi:hypothetical protein